MPAGWPAAAAALATSVRRPCFCSTEYRAFVERRGLLTVDELTKAVEAGVIDTVLVAIADMQGRLQGKRFHGRYFLDEVAGARDRGLQLPARGRRRHDTGRGLRAGVVGAGYGDFGLAPDLSTLRRSRGTPAPRWCWPTSSGTTARPSRRRRGRSCARQIDRLAERGWPAMVGTELEFIVFRDTYEDAWRRGYRGLTPANQYNVDYSLLGTSSRSSRCCGASATTWTPRA